MDVSRRFRRLFPLLALAVPVPVAAQDSAGFFRDAEPYLDLRYRHEQVEQANVLRDARAHTLRTRVGLRSGQWHGLSAVLEVDNVARLGSARYNDTRNGRSGHAVIADPQGTHINQALLRFQRPQFELGLGRQRINLGNQRFVGGVAWRQNEQTFDGVSMQVSPRQGLDLRYAWLGQVNTIFGRWCPREPRQPFAHRRRQPSVRPELRTDAEHPRRRLPLPAGSGKSRTQCRCAAGHAVQHH